MTKGPKRATRWLAEVVDEHGKVMWEVLAHDLPEPALESALAALGFRVRRTSADPSRPLTLVYSRLDPANSVKAAREHAARRETFVGNALVLLLDADGAWVSRDEIRRVAGDQGDRRVRDLRDDRKWPIEIKQLTPRGAWHFRLVLDGPDEPTEPEPGPPTGPEGTLFE